MKPTITIVILLFSLHLLAQQPHKGSFLLGNQFSIVSNTSNISLTVRTQVAYFVNNNLAVGLSTVPTASSIIYKAGSVTTQKPAIDSVDRYMKNAGIVSPLVRYSFVLNSKFMLYVQGSLETYQFRSNVENNSQVIKQFNMGATGSLGMSYSLGILSVDFIINQPFSKGIISDLPLKRTPFVGIALNAYYNRTRKSK